MKRHIAFLLILCSFFSLLCNASAAEALDSTEAESRVVLTSAAPAVFSVTVPSSLPVALKADGTAEVATNAKIINNSVAPVVVSTIAINGLNGWSVLDYATNFASVSRGSKSLSMSINGVGVLSGVIATDGGSFPAISALSGENELIITYAGKVAQQTTAITTAVGVAEVVFTVCWDYF